MRAERFFFDLDRVVRRDMFQLKDSAAKYAIVLGNYKLAMLF
jgi:hypothetical protein